MIYIPITIRNKAASNPTERIVCNNSDDVIRFDFDEEWEAHPLNRAAKRSGMRTIYPCNQNVK